MTEPRTEAGRHLANDPDFLLDVLAIEDQAAQAARAEIADIDVNQARRSIVDDIGAALSREFAQGSPFEPMDRLYVAKTITRVLDAARDRIRLAEGGPDDR